MGAKMAAKYNCVLILVMSLDRSQMIISALQCRLECEPGYVAQRTPLITCVKGKYAKGGSRRCNACVRRFAEEQTEQQRRTQPHP